MVAGKEGNEPISHGQPAGTFVRAWPWPETGAKTWQATSFAIPQTIVLLRQQGMAQFGLATATGAPLGVAQGIPLAWSGNAATSKASVKTNFTRKGVALRTVSILTR